MPEWLACRHAADRMAVPAAETASIRILTSAAMPLASTKGRIWACTHSASAARPPASLGPLGLIRLRRGIDPEEGPAVEPAALRRVVGGLAGGREQHVGRPLHPLHVGGVGVAADVEGPFAPRALPRPATSRSGRLPSGH